MGRPGAASLRHFPGDRLYDRIAERFGVRSEPLATPPPGSGLTAVPGERGLPLIGKTVTMLRDADKESVRLHAQYGDVFWTSSFGQRMVWVVGPDAVQEVLQNKGKVYSQSGWEFFIGPFFNRGLMLLDGQEHLLHRRIMQEAFTRPRLEGYLAQLLPLIDRSVAEWASPEPVEVYHQVKSLSLEIATRVFMGAEAGAETQPLIDAFEDTVRAGTGLIRRDVPLLPFTRWHRGIVGRRLLEAHFRALLPAKRASTDDDLFAALCHVRTEQGESFSDDDIVNHMIFLMMAAHDTSTITTTAIASFLARAPEWQERARAESQALGEVVDLGSLEKLQTLDLVFQEAMRLVAPVPALVRRTTCDTALAGRHVPAGTIVSVAPGAVHVLPEWWSRPNDFEPERFTEPRQEQKGHRYLSVPFGGGAHKCIGMAFGTAEVKALMHRVLLTYELSVPDGYEVEWDKSALPRPVDGLPVTLRRI